MMHHKQTTAAEQAIFAAGCFWGVEEAFRTVPGVLTTEAGYTGGRTEHPRYEEVCTGTTGHAEAVRVTFDPSIVTYDELLALFWTIHDPTSVHRQGPDSGSQYRSAIFPLTEEQREQAETAKQVQNEQPHFRGTIVTEIVPAGPFYRAEESHQQYLFKGGRGTCGL